MATQATAVILFFAKTAEGPLHLVCATDSASKTKGDNLLHEYLNTLAEKNQKAVMYTEDLVVAGIQPGDRTLYVGVSSIISADGEEIHQILKASTDFNALANEVQTQAMPVHLFSGTRASSDVQHVFQILSVGLINSKSLR